MRWQVKDVVDPALWRAPEEHGIRYGFHRCHFFRCGRPASHVAEVLSRVFAEGYDRRAFLVSHALDGRSRNRLAFCDLFLRRSRSGILVRSRRHSGDPGCAVSIAAVPGLPVDLTHV